jgi:hypothetical protein
MYCTIHLLEIIRLSDYSSPLFYPSLLDPNASYSIVFQTKASVCHTEKIKTESKEREVAIKAVTADRGGS